MSETCVLRVKRRVPGQIALAARWPRLGALSLLALAIGAGHLHAQAITGYQKIGERRVSRTVVEYTYRAALTAGATALPGATATASSLVTATVIIDGTLAFGPAAAGASSGSLDTFTFRHDRAVPFDWSHLRWTVVVADTPNTPPEANAGSDQRVAPGATVSLDGSASSDADGDPLTYTWTLTSVPPGSAATLDDSTAVTPGFVADVPGTYAAALVVSDGLTSSAPDEVLVSTENVPPVADAGAGQSVRVGEVVVLDGSGSSDADDDPLSFAWTLTALPPGSLATLVNASSPTASFIADVPGTYVAELVVHDGAASSAPDTVAVTTMNAAPVARAGDNLTVDVGQLVLLDGSASSDPDNDPLAFAWAMLARPDGSSATLDAASTPAPSFVADVAGAYVVQLIVNDGRVESVPDSVLVRTANRPPIADAGPDRSAGIGGVVQLDGRASSDPDGTAVGYAWSFTLRPDGSASALTGATSPAPSFVPDLPGAYVVELIVDDGELTSAPDSVTITADVPVITVSASDASAAEAGRDPARLTIARTGDTSLPLTVRLSVEGTAVNGNDYETIAPSVTIPAGADSLDIVVLPIDDTAFELDESVLLRLADDPAYVVGDPALATVTIADNDLRVVVTTSDGAADEEGSDPAAFTVSRFGPTTAPLVVSFTLTGTATEGADFVTPGRTVTIPAGAGTAPVFVAPIDDGLFEGPETVTLTLVAAAGYSVGVPNSATVTILDDERPVVTVAATDEDASEAGADSGTFTIARTGPTTGPLTVALAVAGTASNGIDYATIGPEVIIPAGAATATVTIVPIDDAAVEGAEGVILVVEPGTGYLVGTPGIALLTIADDDLSVVTIVASDAEASEAGPATGTFTVSRTGDVTSALLVFLARTGTAANNADYAALGGSNFVVTVPAGQQSTTVTLTPLHDNLVEPAETVVLTINASLSYVVGAANSATVTIADDPPVIAVVASDAAAAEAGPDPGVFSFTRTGGNTAAALEVSFTATGSATQASDYPSIGGSVTFPAGQASATRIVTPRPDNAVEGSETVVVSLPGNAVYVPGAQGSATVTIADDPAVVSIAATDPAASESGPDRGTFTLSRTGGDLSLAVLVFLDRGGTAQNGGDYARLGISSFAVTIPAHQVSASFDVVPLADNLVESAETVEMTILASASYTIGGSHTAAVTIQDDPPVVNVVASDPDAAEAGADPATFTFTRSGGNTSAALSVTFSRGGTASSGADYANFILVVSIPAGQVAAAVHIVPIDDAVVEGPETVVVTVNASSTVAVGAQASATVTIHDDD